MVIQFSQQEIEEIRHYFTRINAGEIQKQVQEHQQDFPEWNTIFLLLRKLLAYGIYSGLQTDQTISYKELQAKTQKSKDMLLYVHTYPGQFESLLTAYTALHSC